jgi:hypothetical protein
VGSDSGGDNGGDSGGDSGDSGRFSGGDTVVSEVVIVATLVRVDSVTAPVNPTYWKKK